MTCLRGQILSCSAEQHAVRVHTRFELRMNIRQFHEKKNVTDMGWECYACSVRGGTGEAASSPNVCSLRDWGDSAIGVGYIRPYACCNCSLKLGRVTRNGEAIWSCFVPILSD